nr:leucine-rich repeat-containing protein [Tanacetum cinerariifolium]GEW67026.1 leucine-rich repeat-containing protein [Tanacetum cinerariifolium]
EGKGRIKPSHEPQLEIDEGDAGESGFTWEVVMLGYGCGTVLGLVMGYFMLSTRKVKWFNAISDPFKEDTYEKICIYQEMKLCVQMVECYGSR